MAHGVGGLLRCDGRGWTERAKTAEVSEGSIRRSRRSPRPRSRLESFEESVSLLDGQCDDRSKLLDRFGRGELDYRSSRHRFQLDDYFTLIAFGCPDYVFEGEFVFRSKSVYARKFLYHEFKLVGRERIARTERR